MMKGAITFRFDCDEDTEAQAYWNAMVEASRRLGGVRATEVVIELREMDAAPAASESRIEATVEEPIDPEPGVFARPSGWR